MANLTEKSFWNDVHDGARSKGRGAGRPRALVKSALDEDFVQAVRSYREYVLWKTYYEPHMPRTPGAKVIEIGSAPGTHLVHIHQSFGLNPYGLEYAEVGAEANRKVFTDHNIPAGNVIEADFFSDVFLDQYRGSFDVVLSRGFIEHFDDVGKVVDRHVALLKPGGKLFIMIPNFTGLNALLCKAFDPELLTLHNLEIMEIERFRQLFDKPELTPIACSYLGTFNLSLLMSNQQNARKLILESLQRTVQPLLNASFALLFKEHGAESRWTSPYLIYVGAKRA